MNFKQHLIWVVIATCMVQAHDLPLSFEQKPIDESFIQVLEKELKKPTYLRDVLPGSFSYFLQLLNYAKQTKQPIEFTQSTFTIFTNLMKGTPFINAYVFDDVIQKLPNLLSHTFEPHKAKMLVPHLTSAHIDAADRFKQAASALMYDRFSNQYTQFCDNPGGFLDILAQQMMELAQEEMQLDTLRSSIVRFLETGLGKVAWSPQDAEKSWQSLQSIASSVSTLMKHNILDSIVSVDNALWSAIHRYCFFVDVMGNDLPFEFYATVRNDLASKKLFFLEIEEQESFIPTKMATLSQTIMLSQARKMELSEAGC